ncbi:efflux transporter periplasmic adaptor subunit [Rhizorhabdus dicambivorans]|uniref:Efflux transporter periplasmic adaptor subunit n=2 Tax=Rhizorhabdus dicambivorans TaxID=1850238 RepID=A0A2A4FZ90_9SPHN|nr:efflux transporter periplasmic adaptor subunit [Rhizorhabdus dicambivorans]
MGMNVESGIQSDYAAYDYDDVQARRRRRIVIGIAVAVLIGVIAATMMFFGGKKPAPAAPAAPGVTVIVPGSASVDATVSATGSLFAKREMPVGVAGEGGMVQSVLVEPGSWVGAGQTLAVIERSVQTEQANSLAASVRVARADAQLAQAELDRAKALVARGFISKADIDRRTATRDAAAARVAVAQAQYGQQRATIGRLIIRSPAAGLVLTRAVEPGQVVGPGNGALFRVAKGGEMELRAQLAEQDIARIRVGNGAEVTPIGSKRAFNGTVWQISPVIVPQTRQGVARVQLAYDPALRPGGFASVVIKSGTTQAPMLPESAVLNDEKSAYVYVVGPDNKVVRRDVKVGDVSDAGVVILSGIQGNEKIVLSAGAFLNPGDKVTPQLSAAPTR